MGSPRYRVPAELRAVVARLMRESDLGIGAIALSTGVSLGTLCKWNRAEGWRPVRVMRRDWDASPPRLAALSRLARPRPGLQPTPPGVAPGGTERGAAAHTDQAASDPAAADHDAAGPVVDDLPTLRAALRAHVGRQIAAFDAALRGEGAAVIDSARVLRDLGGLKRLLDDLGGEGGDDGSGLAVELDLPALRAGIAQRYAGLLAERLDAGLPGGPAGDAPPGPVP